MENYYLGIDNGGTATKAALFNRKGEELAAAGRTVENRYLQDGGSERDPNLVWKDTCSVIREVINSAMISPGMIKGIACTGYGNGLLLADEKGDPVRPAINSTDSRAQGYVDSWTRQGIHKIALPLTAQCIWSAQPNTLLAWLRDREPEALEKARWIFMAKDYIRFKVTGEAFAEITDMSGTSLMNVPTGKYDNGVLKIFGIEEIRDMLPPLIGSTDLAGQVTEEAAKLTGLEPGTPVAGGMFDIDACGLASGIVDEEQMSMVIGTWGNNQYIAQEPLIDENLFMTSIYSIPGWYLMLEGSPTSASNLDWFIRNFCAAEQEQMGDQFFQWLNGQVEECSLESDDLMFLPFLYGCNEKNPVDAGFYHLKGHHTRSHLLRAVYEGIVFAHKSHIERLLNFREKPKVIRCTGGATGSEVWMQIFADAIGIPMEIPSGTQLGALGAAMAAAVCTGEYSDLREAVRHMTSLSRRFEPRPEKEPVYAARYAGYREIIQQLQ